MRHVSWPCQDKPFLDNRVSACMTQPAVVAVLFDSIRRNVQYIVSKFLRSRRFNSKVGVRITFSGGGENISNALDSCGAGLTAREVEAYRVLQRFFSSSRNEREILHMFL